MHESIRFGTIRGIAIGCNWSVLAVATLLAWGLARGYLPEAAPGYGIVEYWLVAGVAVALFLGALLAHELGHSLVAQQRGVRVESITLWLFGGVARLRDEAPSPRSELAIASAGPGVSLSAAVLFTAGAFALDGVAAPGLVLAALVWMALVNGMLVVFNLVPAAPLDGGRILHALVWGATHDRSRATRVATSAGRAFGYVLIAIGVIAITGGSVGGAWLALIGWFILMAAGAEATAAEAEGEPHNSLRDGDHAVRPAERPDERPDEHSDHSRYSGCSGRRAA